MVIEISLLLALVGCAVGVLGWGINRDKRISADAQWKGEVNAKLDVIVGLRSAVSNLDQQVNLHGERISKVEASAAQAHRRIDEMRGKIGE